MLTQMHCQGFQQCISHKQPLMTDITWELSQSGLWAVHCNQSPTWNASTAGQSSEKLTDEGLRKAQQHGPVLSVWMKALEHHQKPPEDGSLEGSSHRALYQTFDRPKLVNGVLYRDTCVRDQKRKQLVLPAKCIPEVLKSSREYIVDISQSSHPRHWTFQTSRTYHA